MSDSARPDFQPAAQRRMRLFLCGDVMTGRGIDQVLPHPCNPELHESSMPSALGYVHLAEAAHGQIPRSVEPSYLWGEALRELNRMRPDARIINLETSVTRSDDYVCKGINYRMSPENAACLTAAAIDCCVLGNNHVLDWGRSGLLDTLTTLRRLKIKTAGAGQTSEQAAAPAVLDVAPNSRVQVFSFAATTSGTPRNWAARSAIPGVNLLTEISAARAFQIAEKIESAKRPGDLIVVSLHWGPNWGYEILPEQRQFARTLVDKAAVSIVHGHSSHHPKAIEIYRDRLILYGCGDFLNDYEGIGGYEQYRDDLVLMYFADLEPAGDICALEIVPLQIRKFQLVRPSDEDISWMRDQLDRECRRFGAGIALMPDGHLALSWERRPAQTRST